MRMRGLLVHNLIGVKNCHGESSSTRFTQSSRGSKAAGLVTSKDWQNNNKRALLRCGVMSWMVTVWVDLEKHWRPVWTGLVLHVNRVRCGTLVSTELRHGESIGTKIRYLRAHLGETAIYILKKERVQERVILNLQHAKGWHTVRMACSRYALVTDCDRVEAEATVLGGEMEVEGSLILCGIYVLNK